jgi:RNA recognition motif-containing protein
VSDVSINIDKQSGKSKGFAFVTMDDARDAADAVKALKGYELYDRAISVDVAHGGGSNTGFISRPKVYSHKNRRPNDSNRWNNNSSSRDAVTERRDERYSPPRVSEFDYQNNRNRRSRSRSRDR